MKRKVFFFSLALLWTGRVYTQYYTDFEDWPIMSEGYWSLEGPGGWYTGDGVYVNFGNEASGLRKVGFNDAGDALLIGLGGGSVAEHFADAGWTVDAVEIDPVVVRFALDHFAFAPDDARIFTMDGRQFLRTTDKKYDIIILDAFGSGSIPFHLVTSEAFELVSSRLDANGLLAINMESIGWKSTIVESMAATLKEHFENILVLPIAEPPNRFGNIIVLASNRALRMKDEMPQPESRFSAAYDRIHAWDNRFEPDTDGALVLTDDLNPADLWGEEINLIERRELREYFKDLKDLR